MATNGNIITTSTGLGLDTRISMEAASTLVCSKLSFYQAMVANKFLMPKYKEPIVTVKFMIQARENILWLPKRVESQMIQLASPPPRAEIANEFVLAVRARVAAAAADNTGDERVNYANLQKTAKAVGKKLGDSQWLLSILHIIDRHHRYFAKNYFYVRPKPQAATQAAAYVDNSDGFFSGLRPVDNPSGRFRLDKLQRKAMQMSQLEVRQNQMREKMQKMQAEMMALRQEAAQRDEDDDFEQDEASSRPEQDFQDNQVVSANAAGAGADAHADADATGAGAGAVTGAGFEQVTANLTNTNVQVPMQPPVQIRNMINVQPVDNINNSAAGQIGQSPFLQNNTGLVNMASISGGVRQPQRLNQDDMSATMLSQIDHPQQNDSSVNKASPYLKATPRAANVIRNENPSLTISAGVKSRSRTKALNAGIKNVSLYVKDNEEMKEM